MNLAPRATPRDRPDGLAPLILGSSSPRRRDLLRSAGLRFDIHPAEIAEEQRASEAPETFVQRTASDKARWVAARRAAAGDDRPVLGADTTVIIDGRALGKPRDRDEARSMLERLSGRDHHVLTAVCLHTAAKIHERLCRTRVTFKVLSSRELERYLDRAAWQDKAGAYAIQAEAAYIVRAVDGSYTNVMGLPLCETYELLVATGIVDG